MPSHLRSHSASTPSDICFPCLRLLPSGLFLHRLHCHTQGHWHAHGFAGCLRSAVCGGVSDSCALSLQARHCYTRCAPLLLCGMHLLWLPSYPNEAVHCCTHSSASFSKAVVSV
jgi:hypothetical protein